MFTFGKPDTKKALLPQKRDPKRYAEERALSQSENTSDRLKLAKSETTHKEILYYLAENDPNETVRKAVARNLMTPLQASEVIAKDKSVDVRMALVKRLCILLPDLSADEYSQLYAHVVQALSMLALDEVIKVRRSLATSLKDKAYMPPKVATQLAKDVERDIAEPILKFCITIPDLDLIEILKTTTHKWAAIAIAEREKISADVSRAVVERTDIPEAGAKLLANPGASITEEILDYIIEKAKEMPEWHRPLAERKNLPADMTKRIASFVSKRIAKKMMQSSDIDNATRQDIEDTTKRRLNFLRDEKGRPITAKDKLKSLKAEERLNEEALEDALALGELEFVILGIASLSQIKANTVQKIILTKAPKAVVALAWKAKLSARFSLKMQQDLAKIDHKELIYPKADKYPLDDNTMEFQLDFFRGE